MARSDYYLRHPRYHKFYKVLAVLSYFLGLGRHIEWYYKNNLPRYMKYVYALQLCVLHTALYSSFISQMIYFYIYYNDMSSDTRGTILVIIPATFYTMLTCQSSQLRENIRVMKDFMSKYHLCNYNDNGDEHIQKIRIRAEILTRLACYFMITFLMLDWFSWSFVTVFNNFKAIDLIHNRSMIYQTSLYCVWPMDYRYDFKNWLIVHTFNVYALFVGCSVILLHNSMNYAFVIQLIGHIKILKYKLKTEFVGDLSDDEYRQKLVDVVKYHSVVMSHFGDIQAAFGFNVTSMYAYNLLTDSVLLYQLMVGNTSNIMMYGLMLPAYLGGLSVLSFVLEEIRRQSDDLSDLVYYINWEDMSVSNRKTLVLLLLRIQPPMVFTSAGGLECGVKPLISILQSTFSYYTMLKSRTEI